MKRIATIAVLAVLLLSAVETRADAEALRLKPISGNLVAPCKADTLQAKEAAFAATLKEKYPAFDAADPICDSLLWFYSHWAGYQAGTAKVNEKYANLGVEYF
ncbi:MAG: hypothetical protein ACLFV7_03330, partial [Phycisphaerae bacterium]